MAKLEELCIPGSELTGRWTWTMTSLPELSFWFSAGSPIVALWAMATTMKRTMEKKDFILIDDKEL